MAWRSSGGGRSRQLRDWDATTAKAGKWSQICGPTAVSSWTAEAVSVTLSSPDTSKAGATSALRSLSDEKIEQRPKSFDLVDSGIIRHRQCHGEAVNRVEPTCGPLPRGNPTGFLEQAHAGGRWPSCWLGRWYWATSPKLSARLGCGDRL